jgi:hypothetical protein
MNSILGPIPEVPSFDWKDYLKPEPEYVEEEYVETSGRQVVRLEEDPFMTFREIAAVLGLDEKTVRNDYNRAIEKLSKRCHLYGLTPECLIPEPDNYVDMRFLNKHIDK